MESAGLRHRSRDAAKQQPATTATATVLEITPAESSESSIAPAPKANGQPAFLPITLRAPRHDRDEDAVQPPRFTVDLSDQPEHRYDHVAEQLRDTVAVSDLEDIFDELVCSVAPRPLVPALHFLARHALRGLYSAEETAELRGIAAASGISFHILVAFNVLLDLLLGCSSGGVRVRSPGATGAAPPSRILHFRTLDWGMEELRALTVELDFVRRPGGPVVATSVTYFGYVGVLTGVRPGLSMSLNFRPHHDRSTWRRRLAFRWHQVTVVLGFRQSVSSVLRAVLLTPDSQLDDRGDAGTDAIRWFSRQEGTQKTSQKKRRVSAPIIPYILDHLPSTRSTAAYLIFCTPNEARTLEKDNGHGRFHSSSVFHATYNHDVEDEANPQRLESAAHGAAEEAVGMEAIVEMSITRARRMERRFDRAVRKRRGGLPCLPDSVHPDDLLKMVLDEEICNEETHYAVVMDPGLGKVIWRRVFPFEVYPDEYEGSNGAAEQG